VVAPGGICDVLIGSDTVLTASAPVLVEHLMVAGNDTLTPESSSDGDPSASWAIPTSRYLPTYLVYLPAGFTSHLMVTAEDGTPVVIDGEDVTGELDPIGGSGHVAGRFPLAAGEHRVDCRPGVCGVSAAGIAPAVSYFFPAGIAFPIFVP
jgi:hypothetical protein